MEIRYHLGPGTADYVITVRDLTEKKWRKLEAALSSVQRVVYAVIQLTTCLIAIAAALAGAEEVR